MPAIGPKPPITTTATATIGQLTWASGFGKLGLQNNTESGAGPRVNAIYQIRVRRKISRPKLYFTGVGIDDEGLPGATVVPTCLYYASIVVAGKRYRCHATDGGHALYLEGGTQGFLELPIGSLDVGTYEVRVHGRSLSGNIPVMAARYASFASEAVEYGDNMLGSKIDGGNIAAPGGWPATPRMPAFAGIVGEAASASPIAVQHIGMSIVRGTGASAERGYCQLAAEALLLPDLTSAIGGSTSDGWLTEHIARFVGASWCDRAVVDYWTNDIASSTSLVTMQARALSIGTILNSYGISWIGASCWPRNAFTAPQAAVAKAFNEWLSTQTGVLPGMVGYAATGEALVSNPGAGADYAVWANPAIQGDGVHGTDAAHQAAATVLQAKMTQLGWGA